MSKELVSLKSMRTPRNDAWIYIAVSLGFSAVLLLDEDHLGFGQAGLAGATIVSVLILALGMLNLLPERFWFYGIDMKDDGFFFHHQLRRTRFIRYNSIYHISASSVIGGSGESTCTLRLKSLDGSARLEEDSLYGTGLLDALMATPGFSRDAWLSCHVSEDSIFHSLFSKKTVLLDRKPF